MLTGIFSPHAGVPDWASFAQLYPEGMTDDEMRWAAVFAAGRHASGRPFAWVLALTGPSKEAPMADWLPAIAARVDASGVRPYLAAASYREEWYGGQATIAEVESTRAWVASQHDAIRRQWPGLAIVGIEQFWCPTPAFGPGYYRPDYGNDIRAIEAYVPKGETWQSALMDAKLTLACGESVGPYRMADKPVVIISQAFRGGTGEWSEWATDDTLAQTARWLRHPKVIAHWPFDYAGSPAGNWQGWPEHPRRAVFDRMMGVS